MGGEATVEGDFASFKDSVILFGPVEIEDVGPVNTYVFYIRQVTLNKAYAPCVQYQTNRMYRLLAEHRGDSAYYIPVKLRLENRDHRCQDFTKEQMESLSRVETYENNTKIDSTNVMKLVHKGRVCMPFGFIDLSTGTIVNAFFDDSCAPILPPRKSRWVRAISGHALLRRQTEMPCFCPML